MMGMKIKESLDKLAWLVSRVLDPVILIPLTLVLAVSVALVNGERMWFILFLLFVDGVLPAFVLIWFVKQGSVLSGWDVRDRRERIPLFFFVTLAHALGVLVAWFGEKQPLAIYLTSFWLLTVIYAVVTLYWKISVHVGVLCALITFAVLAGGPDWLWLYSLVFLMVWARVWGRHHRLSQALAGGVVPVLVLPLVFLWFGLI